MGYTTTVTDKLKKHAVITFGIAILSTILVGLSAMLPMELAVPLGIFFVAFSVGALIVLGNIVYKWFDQNY